VLCRPCWAVWYASWTGPHRRISSRCVGHGLSTKDCALLLADYSEITLEPVPGDERVMELPRPAGERPGDRSELLAQSAGCIPYQHRAQRAAGNGMEGCSSVRCGAHAQHQLSVLRHA
jgi:hypothetical protein